MPSKKDTKSAVLTERSGAFAERIPDNVLLEPIAYIFADHCRFADMCDALNPFVAQRSSAPDLAPDLGFATAILKCLKTDIPLHIADEDINLIPLLSARVLDEDHFDEILRLLDQEQSHDRLPIDPVRDGFACFVRQDVLDTPDVFYRAVETFSSLLLNHIHWENTVVLPLARKRLTAQDLTTMGRAMAARRDIDYPGIVRDYPGDRA